jgi:hypothetical protein
MRVSDLSRIAATRGMFHFLEKRGLSLPLVAIGTQIPGAVRRATHRYEEGVDQLNRATDEKLDASASKRAFDVSSVLGGMAGTKPQMGQMGSLGGHLGGHALMSMLSPILQAPSQGIAERIKGVFAPKPPGMLDNLQGKALETFGKSLGETGAGLVRDLVSKAVAAVGSAGDQSARVAILRTLKLEDPILAEADDKTLMEAYHTMTRFAPVLSTDKNAVRSFLRQAVTSGAGPDYASIKLLADSERAVTGQRSGD